MPINSIKVYINKNHSGSLSLENSLHVFNYLNDSQDLVSLTMPKRVASYNSQNLHPIFQMNLPEGALKDAIKNHFSKLQSMDDFNLLRLVGPYMLGRIKFDKLADEKEKLELHEILTSTKATLFEELMERFALRSGVSGVQPKLLLKAHNKTTMKLEEYIVKSWGDEYPNLALNEYFCMRAIKNSGLHVSDFYISDDYKMFVMKRFDTLEDGRYLGFEDMCVLTGRGTDEKYRGSYEQCARVIKDIIPPHRRAGTLKTFFKALVMNHLLKNGDAHLKNYGVLYENDFGDSFLAPIYDVITTTLYIKSDIPALNLGGDKLWWKLKTYQNFAKQSCGLSKVELEEILCECKEAIIKTKNEINEFIKADTTQEKFLQDLMSCWAQEIL